jgi:Protein of unknown function (DUF3108)
LGKNILKILWHRYVLLTVVITGLFTVDHWTACALQRPEMNSKASSGIAGEFNPRLGTFYYIIDWGDSKAADATVTIERDGDYFRMVADEETTKFLDRIYRIKYRGETVIRAHDLSPMQTVINAQKGKRKKVQEIRYRADGGVETVVTKTKPGTPLEIEAYLINKETFAIDMFAAIFLARSFEWQVNESQQFEVFTENKLYLLTMDCIGKSIFESGDIKTPAWVIRPGVLKLNDPKAKTKHGKARVYLSADDSRDLLKIKTNIGFGTVKMKLIKYEPNQ